MICMAREYYERLVLDLEYYRKQDPTDYWIYEFSETEAKKLEYEKAATLHGMTMEEYLVGAIERAFEQVHFDPERPQEKPTKKAGRESDLQLVRYYPVFKGETEEQAYLRKLAEEKASGEIKTGDRDYSDHGEGDYINTNEQKKSGTS